MSSPVQQNPCAEIVTEHSTEIHNIRYDGDTELCSNWWPSRRTMLEKAPGMPHPLCQLCANWLPDIEEIGNICISNTKQSGCGNDWPASKNKICNNHTI